MTTTPPVWCATRLRYAPRRSHRIPENGQRYKPEIAMQKAGIAHPALNLVTGYRCLGFQQLQQIFQFITHLADNLLALVVVFSRIFTR